MFNWFKNLFEGKLFSHLAIFIIGLIIVFLICHYSMFHKVEERLYKASNEKMREDLHMETKKFEILPFWDNKLLSSLNFGDEELTNLPLIRIYDRNLKSVALDFIYCFTKIVNSKKEIKNRNDTVFLESRFLKGCDEPFMICKFKDSIDFINCSEEFNKRLISFIFVYESLGMDSLDNSFN